MPGTDEPTARLAQLTPARRALLEKWKQGKSGRYTEIAPRRDAGPVPLSFQQQRLWFLHQLEPDAAAYTMSITLELTGTLHIQALEQSLTLLVQRHESLRTCFPTLNEQPFQHILPPTPLRLILLDLSSLTADAHQKEIHLLLKRLVRRPVSLAAGPLFRQGLLRLAPQRHMLILTMHHTIYDGLSLNILLRELATFYSATLAGVSASLPPLPLNYANYAIWQREWLQGKEQAALASYWKQQLQNAPTFLELPADRPRPPMQGHNGARLRSLMSDSLISRLKSWGKQEGATLFMVTLAAFQILLARYSGQSDFMLGTPVANRSRPEFEPLIGFFANTLALRTTIAGNPTFRSFLQQTRRIALEAFAHQEFPFEQLVETLQPPRSLSYNPLVQIIFSLDELVIPTLEMPGLTLGIFPVDSGLSQFDLTFSLININNSIEIHAQYNTDLFDETTIAHLIEHYLHLLEAAIDNPEQRIYELPLLLESERERILFGWNETRASYPDTCCIHELFEAQAQRTPDALAVVLDECVLSYQELNKRANQLAWHLRTLEVGPEHLVGLCLPRSLEMLVGLLGILKAGGAYLPLDPSYPRERLTYLIEDSQVELVLTLHDVSAGIEAQHLTLLDLASEWPRIAASSASEVQSGVMPSNLAYVIYTSGSSGQPKGVLISHSALVSHSATIARRFELRPADRVLQFASLSFDVAAEEIFPTWLAGAGLVLHSSQLPLSFEDLTTLLWQKGLTVLNLPTSYWHLWTAHLVETEQALPDSLRLLIVGSESAFPDQLQNWYAHYGQRIGWYHAYGVTESTITSTLYELPTTPVV